MGRFFFLLIFFFLEFGIHLDQEKTISLISLSFILELCIQLSHRGEIGTRRLIKKKKYVSARFSALFVFYITLVNGNAIH